MIRGVVKQQWFYWAVILLVFFNTCCVAVEHYDQPDWLSEFLEIAEYVYKYNIKEVEVVERQML